MWGRVAGAVMSRVTTTDPAEQRDALRAARIRDLEALLQASEERTGVDDPALVTHHEELGRLLIDAGRLDDALAHLRERELPLHRRRGDERSAAATMEKVADILQARCQYDDALRVRQQDLLPVHKRMGDERAHAITMGKIADVLQMRGKFDTALRMRLHDELPIHERMGDERARAETLAKIADIHLARGQFPDAQRILERDVLPVANRLGDERARAVTARRNSDVLSACGQLDDAMRSLNNDVLPVFERLGDARERAHTLTRIADILEAKGDHEQPMRIRRNEVLPVYERLGDLRSIAITQGKIGLQLAQRGGVERERGAELLTQALASLRAMGLHEAPALAQRMKTVGMPTKRKREPVDDGWTKFEGDFSAADLQVAARSAEAIEKLSIRTTPRTRSTPSPAFTRTRSRGLRGMRAKCLGLGCSVTKAAMADVIAIEGLRELYVIEVVGRGAMPSFANAVALEEFRCSLGFRARDTAAVVQAPALRTLSVQNSKLDLPLVRTFATLPNLRTLDLESTNFDDEMAKAIASHTTLTGLDLGSTRLTARGLAHICSMRNLESLDLWQTNIGIDDLQQLQALDHLQYLSIGKVDDSRPEGCDGNTAFLVNSIRGGIRVEGDPSHDAQAIVDLLLRMPWLERVWLDGVKLSPEQKQLLESRLESLRI